MRYNNIKIMILPEVALVLKRYSKYRTQKFSFLQKNHKNTNFPQRSV
jgi:hypothetical protein